RGPAGAAGGRGRRAAEPLGRSSRGRGLAADGGAGGGGRRRGRTAGGPVRRDRSSRTQRGARLQRDVAVLAERQALLLALEHAQVADQRQARVLGVDHVVDVALGRRHVGVVEALLVLLDLLGARRGRVGGA